MVKIKKHTISDWEQAFSRRTDMYPTEFRMDAFGPVFVFGNVKLRNGDWVSNRWNRNGKSDIPGYDIEL